MSVRFILGRSGSGKTQYCIDSIVHALTGRPTGPALILLVPDQATFQMEQALLADSRIGGYHRARVVSFSRLARLVLQETSPPARPVLSESARRMVLRRLLQQHQDELKLFARLADRSGFIDQLASTIRELRQYNKSPDDLQQQYQQLRDTGDPALGPLADKLADLAVIYRAYQDHIISRYVDPDDFLDLLADRAKQSDILAGADIWIDGFAGFTPQQTHALIAMIRCAHAAQLTLCLDPASEQTRIAQSSPDPSRLDNADLFHPTLSTYQKLIVLFNEHRIEIDSPLTLTQKHRFAPSDQLRKLENTFHLTGIGQSPSASNHPDTSLDDITDGVIVIEAPTRRTEVAALARKILDLCRLNTYRFGDIAVILRDFSDYAELIKSAFDDHAIPYFLDQPRPIRHHPLVELVRSVLDALGSDFGNDPVFRYLRSGLSPLNDTDIDRLENTVLAQGLHTKRWSQAKPWRSPKEEPPDAESVDSLRRRAIAPLIEMKQQLWPDTFDPRQTTPAMHYISALADLLERIDTRAALARWSSRAESQKRLDQAQTHRQVYSALIDLLNEAAAVLHDTPLTFEQFTQIINASLEAQTLGLVPPRLDQVLVGTIERSRHPKIRAAFILGVNEGRFPQVRFDTGFFSDDQRNILQNKDFELAWPQTQRLLHENYLAYIALTRPSELLWLSFPAADEQGSQLAPSLMIDAVCSTLQNTPIHRIPAQDASPASIANKHQLALTLAGELSPLLTAKPVDDDWLTLGRWAVNHDAAAPIVRRAFNGIDYQNHASLDAAAVKTMFPAEVQSSVSRLECFASCPFRHFAKYLLHLEPRSVLKLGAIDMGSFYHRSLDRMFAKMQQRQWTWSQLDHERLQSLIREVTGELFEQDPALADLAGHSSRNSFLLDQAADHLLRFAKALSAMARAGEFRQTHAELPFGPGKPIPGLAVPLTGEHQLILRGLIDRVDACSLPDGRKLLAVIDYKSSARPFDYQNFYYGLSLQLVSYLNVISQHVRKADASKTDPVAALYIPITPKGKSQTGPLPDHLLHPDSPHADRVSTHKARGVIRSDAYQSLDQTLQPTQRSQFYSIYVNKDNSVVNNWSTDVLQPEELADLLRSGRALLADLGNRMTAGDIDVRPYRLGKISPCPQCDYHPLCRFDYRTEPYRTLTPCTKQQVLDRIKNPNHSE